jgi:hypothetical protein
MAWQSTGPDTLVQGRFTLYKSSLPAEVYWLSIDGGDPIRRATKEEVQAVIRRTNGES